MMFCHIFFFNDTATTEIYTLSLHDALPILFRSLTAIVSVKLPEPQFEGQTKTKLGNTFMRGIVDSISNEEIGAFMEENPSVAKVIVDKCLRAQRAREAAKKARDITRRKSVLETTSLPGKLADCSEDRKSTRLNSSHANISYAVFCLKKKKSKYMTRGSER